MSNISGKGQKLDKSVSVPIAINRLGDAYRIPKLMAPRTGSIGGEIYPGKSHPNSYLSSNETHQSRIPKKNGTN